MAVCRDVMIKLMRPGDSILQESRIGKSTTLAIHDEVEVTPYQAEAKHLNRGTCLRPSQQREKDSDPLKFPFV